MDFTALHERLLAIRRRLFLIGVSTGFLWGLVGIVSVLAAGVWLDLLWELSPVLRIAVLAGCILAGAAIVGVLVANTWRSAREATLARRVDSAGDYRGQVLTGWELSFADVKSSSARPVTQLLAQKTVARAAQLAAQVSPGQAVSAQPLKRPLIVCLGLASALGLLVWIVPGLAATEWLRFSDPFGEEPPFSALQFQVTPGDVNVRYGDGLEISTTVSGGPVERVELAVRAANDPSEHDEVLPMFAESNGRWRTTLSRLTDDKQYVVRARGGRSKTYRIQVITVPRIEQVRVRVTPPAYTKQPAYEGPLPQGGIAGLRGTKVEFHATSNRPLSGGEVSLKSGDGEPTVVKLNPISPHSQEAVGEFAITRAAKFSLDVFDVDGQRALEPMPGTITLLVDERPFVRILQPRENALATPTASVPVEIAAEDDYGVARVQLFRSLNDSRPLPLDLPVGAEQPRRRHDKLYLQLAPYGLEPGDVIKLFARVEDNDPDGAKGSESKVVTLQIISQEEFERMQRVQAGLKVLLSKYQQAQRRMEGLAKQLEGLRKKHADLANTPEEGLKKLDKQRRDDLREMAKQMRADQEAIRAAAKKLLPYDLDKNLSAELENTVRRLEKMAQETEDLAGLDEATQEQMKKLLGKLASDLADERKAFDEEATKPLEQLAQLFPLIADQQTFVEIVARQRDLAERLASLKGQEGQDNPAAKARMRDLENEQRQIREDLAKLLDDIATRAAELPDDPELAELKETAEKFVKDVRESGAAAAMSEAENALAEFAGTKAHAKAVEAAEILEKFLSQCKSIGSGAGKCIVFRPGLGNKLGDTIGQMLMEMGLGNGGGMGRGMGSGYSARRNSNVGLYGNLPTSGDDPASGSGEPKDATPNGAGGSIRPEGNQPTNIGTNPNAATGATGGENVPARYRTRVGQYFHGRGGAEIVVQNSDLKSIIFSFQISNHNSP